jgi:hypothetical protein
MTGFWEAMLASNLPKDVAMDVDVKVQFNTHGPTAPTKAVVFLGASLEVA